MIRSLWSKIGGFLALLGIAVAGYVWIGQLIAPPHWCVLGERFNCAAVSQSQFGWVDGVFGLVGIPFFHISNALIAIPIFFLVGVGFFWFYRSVRWRLWLRALCGLSLVYALILLYLAIFTLGALCIFCLALDAIILGLVIASWKL
ncbi:MAG: vitamin K epoxide reductase family protein [Nanoarchaeota archaeon]|nr:vitamin K epoxide reductase family protein [Nanoarchaeota archaeon]